MFKGEKSKLPVASHGFKNEGNNQKPKRDILNQATSKSDSKKGLAKKGQIASNVKAHSKVYWK